MKNEYKDAGKCNFLTFYACLQKYYNLTNVIFNDDNIDMKFLCTVYKIKAIFYNFFFLNQQGVKLAMRCSSLFKKFLPSIFSHKTSLKLPAKFCHFLSRTNVLG